MNVIQTIKGVFLSEENKKQSIVRRLVENDQITLHEAMILLKNNISVTLSHTGEINVSSGAKVVAGDDNSTENR